MTSEPVKAVHRWTCFTCREHIEPGEMVQFANSNLFKAFHPGPCYERRVRHYRSRGRVMMEILGLCKGK